MITTVVTIGSLLFYTIGYSFLYGYYFSGSIESDISLIDLLIKSIPFPTYSVIITSIAFTLAIVLFIFILYSLNVAIRHLLSKGEREYGLIRIFATLIGSFIFHIVLTTFFVGDFSSSSDILIKFSLIWIGPFLLAIFIYSLTRLLKGIFSALSGLLYGLIGITIVTSLMDTQPSEISILVTFIVALVFSFFEHLTRFALYRFFLFLPTIFLFSLILFQFIPALKPDRFLTVSTSLVIIIIISAILGYFVGRKKDKPINDSKELKLKDETKKHKIGSLLTLLIIVLLSFLATSIPVIAQKTGAYFRELTPIKVRQTITYSNGKSIDNATLVAKKDDLYYISSQDWNLIILKTEQLKVDEPTN
ncbi:hypothetical protein [Bacillus sp. FJAT-27264]|uniref:hypothetical protein n=1 Tax=Paenibacillus sp. (strain DSM 101736 / FJAT-27264) TaxID=1850362 RepID=UPI001111EC66|nr:hypothetical protein [Bacillus sp. FJAT-27264]